MQDVYEEAADQAEIPDHAREKVIEKVRRETSREIVGELSERMHAVLMDGRDGL